MNVHQWDVVEGPWRRATRPMVGGRYVLWIAAPIVLVVAASALRMAAQGTLARENLGVVVTALVAIGAGWVSIVHGARARTLAAAERLHGAVSALAAEVAAIQPSLGDPGQPWRAPAEHQSLLDRWSTIRSQLVVARLLPAQLLSLADGVLLSLTSAKPGREWTELRDHARQDLQHVADNLASRWLI